MQALIFDFGNVVGFFDHARTLRRLARYTDMAAAEMFAAMYQGKVEDDFESGRLTNDEYLRQFRQRCRLACDHGVIAEAVGDIFEPNPEVCSLLPRLKPRYRLLLGSNTNVIHSRQFLVQFKETLSHFQGVVLSHDIGHRKPHAAFFHHCQKLAGCAASECLFIDDLAANVEGAHAVGMQAIHYAPGMDLAAHLRERGVRFVE